MAARKPAKKGDAETSVVLQRLQDDEVDLQISGLTPYIPHKWSEKAKRMMPGHPDKPEQKEAREKRNKEEEAESYTYRLEDGRPGIPASALKAAMVGAARFFPALKIVECKIMFHVIGEGPEQLIPFEGTSRIREDTPRIAMGTADLRYRYEFLDWKATVRIRYLSGMIKEKSIVALLDAAGRLGVGEWRPDSPKSHTGTFGTWRVVAEEDEA